MFNLICVIPFHGYQRGQMVTDPAEVAKLTAERDSHFVRVAAPPTPAPTPAPAAPEAAPEEA